MLWYILGNVEVVDKMIYYVVFCFLLYIIFIELKGYDERELFVVLVLGIKFIGLVMDFLIGR